MTGALSVVATVVFVASGLLVAVTLWRRVFGNWRGSLAVTAVALIWLCWALVVAQLLGAIGLLRSLPLVVAAVASAVAAVALAGGWPGGWRGVSRISVVDTTEIHDTPAASPLAGASPGADAVAPAGWQDTALTVGVVVLVLLVAAVWAARTVIALRRGINDPDSLGYHLPFMATFAHSGYADQHRLLIPLYPVQFYPANDELLSAVALLLTRSVAFAALKNLLFGALVVVAAHAIGRRYRAGRLAVAGAAVVLGFPVIAYSQPGSAVNDSLMLFALLGGLAVLAHAGDRPAPYLLALAAAGLALGVKFSAIVPAAALAALAVVLLVARVGRRRVPWTVAGLLTSAAIGGSWYLRNAISNRNPVPPDRLGLGPVHLTTVTSYLGRTAFSVAHYLIHGRYLAVFGHSAVRALGPVGVVLALAGVVAALVVLVAPSVLAQGAGGDGFLRGLAAFCLAGLAGYFVTPAGAAGTAAQIPYAITVNLHYAAPALLAGILLATLAAARWRASWIVPLVGLAAVLTSFGPGRSIAVWFPEVGGHRFLLLAGAAAAGGAAALASSRRRFQSALRPLVALTAAATLVGLVAIAGQTPSHEAGDEVVQWAAQGPPTSVAAWIANIADLYGPHARNRVTVVAALDHGAAVPVDTCQGWKQAVVAGHFPYTAVIAGTAWARWLRADPAFAPVAKDAGTTVFRVVGAPDLACAGQTNSGADFWVVPGP
ncbi:MAG TPA: hypothetical protein VHT75_12800 [Acidimicrobiales bacterium]|nr:hypothetical protein [Acidimicrobiales bacterium]